VHNSSFFPHILSTSVACPQVQYQPCFAFSAQLSNAPSKNARVREKAEGREKKKKCFRAHMPGQAQSLSTTNNKRLCGVWTFEKLWMEGNAGLENGVENVL